MKKILNSEELKGLHQIEIKMMDCIDKTCKALGIKYYLAAGTLLGAVRHKGFIPWDDDIDILMMRADYERFIREAGKYMPDNYFVQSYLSEKDLPIGFSKVRNSDTAFMETSIRNHRINKGVFIDIFPLDFYPEDKKTQKKLWRKKWKYDVCAQKDFYQSRTFLRKIKRLGFNLLTANISHKKALLLREKMFTSIKPSSLVANYYGVYGEREVMPIEWFGEGVMVDFEGLKLTAPKEYVKYLTKMYGNYMQLPPEEKRVSHHYLDAFDLSKSYKEYEK